MDNQIPELLPETSASPLPVDSSEQLEDQMPVPPRKSRKPLYIGVGVGALALIGGGAWYFAAGNQSAMELAFENCNGPQALTHVMEKSLGTSSTSTPSESPTSNTESADSEENPLAKYFEDVLSLEDDGTTLIIKTKGQDEDAIGISTFAAQCVYQNLAAPTWMQESVQATRALDGRQNAEWDAYQAQWSYHPDSGLSMIITEKQR